MGEESAPSVDFRLLSKDSLVQMEEKVREIEEKQARLKNVSLSKASLSALDELEEQQSVKGKNPELEEGKALPDKYCDQLPKEYYGKPLEEIDPGQITNRSLVIIAKRWGKLYIYRFSTTKAFFLLSPLNPFRRAMMYVASHQLFDLAVMLTIIVNCFFLAWNQTSRYPDIMNISEYVFTGLYTLEMLVKLFARGFVIYKFTYLRDPWNWLDFIVITLAYITIKVNLGNFSGIRTLRVLRALKTISIVPGLKAIINALLGSTRMLLEVMLLTVFVLCIFALFSLQIYMGALRHKCVKDMGDVFSDVNVTDSMWYSYIQNSSNWYIYDGDPLICSNISGAGPCPQNTTCLKGVGGNPNYGYTNFDHFGWAMLTSFQLITLDFWEDVYNHVLRSQGPWHILFFMVAVLFGSFYLINLMLAVVSMSYTEEAERQQEEKKKKGKETANQNLMKFNKNRLKLLMNKKKKRVKRKKKTAAEDGDKQGDTTDGATSDDAATKDRTGTDTEDERKSTTTSKSEDYTDISEDECESESMTSETDPSNVAPASVEIQSNDNSSEKDDDTESIEGDKRVGFHVRMLTDEDTEKPVPCCPYKRCCACCRICCVCNRKCYRAWKRVQSFVYNIIMDPLVDVFITFCIILNTLFLAMDHHGISKEWESVLFFGNYVFTAIFTIECVMKIMALDAAYFKNGWNVFDLFIVTVSLIEIPLQGVKGFSVLRAFRLLRVFKLAQSWATMRMLITIIGNTLSSIGNLTVILFIIIYIFAVIGMQLFGSVYVIENFQEDGEIPRWNFIDFYHSFMMVFRILCGEWIEPLYDCMRGCRAADNGLEGACIAIFIITLVVGNFMVLNLFLALLLNSFASDSLKKSGDNGPDRLKLGIQKLIRIVTCRKYRKSKVGAHPSEKKPLPAESKKEGKKESEKKKAKEEKEDENISQISLGTVENGISKREKASDIEMTDLENAKDSQQPDVIPNGALLSASAANGTLKVSSSNNSIVSSRNGSARSVQERPGSAKVPFKTQRSAFVSFDTALENSKSKSGSESGEKGDGEKDETENKKEGEEGEEEKASSDKIEVIEDPVQDCFCAPVNRFCATRCCCSCCRTFDDTKFGKRWAIVRRYVHKLIEHKGFEGVVLVLICASSFALVFEDVRLPYNPTMKEVLKYLNIFFAVVFTIEMILKWIGYGFVKYYTSFWCWLDFIIVLVSNVSIIASSLGMDGLSAFRALRTLRALRPLRAISRWQGMRIVVNALVHAVPAIFNVLVVCMVFWLIASIMGVQFFGGTFSKCVDDDGNMFNISYVNDEADCATKNGTWAPSDINFDNVINGLLALFQVATFEGWMEVMQASVDSRGVGLQPEREASKYAYLYFFVFIVCGSFFSLNLFIGVIIDNFNVLKKKYEGDSTLDMFLTSNQKNYYQTMKRLGQKKPSKQIKRPTNKVQAFFYDVTTSNKFEISIVLLICLNMIAMGVEHYGQSDEITAVLDVLNIIFVAVFGLEAIMKIIGMRWHYFKRPWNVFDFIIVLLSILGIVLDDLLKNVVISPTLLRVVRVFRIGRVLRLVKAAKGIRKLLFALVISLPALLNIGALLFLIIFIYAIFGMNFFGYVKKDGALDEMVNFETFGNSLILLFRLATSAGWNDVLEPLMVSPPDCDPNYGDQPNGNCGQPLLAVVYFVSFIFLTFLIIINMYIAVILENFSQAHAQEEVGITEDDFDMFYIVWGRYDPHATQFIKFEQVSKFCDELDAPLRLAAPNRIKVTGLNLTLYEGDRVHCLDVLTALTKRVLGEVEESEDFKQLQDEMAMRFNESFQVRSQTVATETTLERKKKETAIVKIQKAWRLFRLKREIGRAASTRSRNSQSSLNSSRKNSALLSVGDSKMVNLDTSFNSSFGNTLTVQPEKYGQTPRGSTPSLNASGNKKTLPRIENTDNAADKKRSSAEEEWDDVPTIEASVQIVNEASKDNKNFKRPKSSKAFQERPKTGKKSEKT
ncbi:sodium channel protein 1 brain-like isoform X2 [Ptychodera flava]|uniref:sodium channel protein 1 brain-like isoform X2 n=1 Tax=Ptychodera flava TaxID=63121 RepID=UPI00396A839C